MRIMEQYVLAFVAIFNKGRKKDSCDSAKVLILFQSS